MQRKRIDPRRNWQQILESYGFEHHSLSSDEEPVDYWNELAYYELTSDEVNRIEFATSQLEAMCLQLVEMVIDENLFDRLSITPYAADLIRRSWDNFERSIYGRFDLSLGADGSIKMLEYNADTPTSLFEAAVAQWEWLQARFPQADQFNSIHEKLIEAWKGREGLIHFASLEDSESVVTTAYLEDTAKQAGLETRFITLKDIGLADGRYVDLQGRMIRTAFKLYPWEWLLTDDFGQHVRESGTQFIEPAWKMVLSNKAMLPLLHDLFPRNKYLLPASYEQPTQSDYVRKPYLGREGNNVQIMKGGRTLAERSGDYDWKYVYQQYHETISFDGLTPIIGSWIVNGQPAGIGMREDRGITTNMARFVPHLILG
jgi:glutathionylspermidine synthase